MAKKKIWAYLERIIELFTQKIVLRSQKYGFWSRNRDPGSGKSIFRIPVLGVKKVPDIESRIHNTGIIEDLISSFFYLQLTVNLFTIGGGEETWWRLRGGEARHRLPDGGAGLLTLPTDQGQDPLHRDRWVRSPHLEESLSVLAKYVVHPKSNWKK